MIRQVALFVVFAVLIHFSIVSWRALSGKERWDLTKTAFYSIMIALLAVIAMTGLVIFF